MASQFFVVANGPLPNHVTAPSTTDVATSCGDGRTAVDLYTDRSLAARRAASHGDGFDVVTLDATGAQEFVRVIAARHSDWCFTINPVGLFGENEKNLTFAAPGNVLAWLGAA